MGNIFSGYTIFSAEKIVGCGASRAAKPLQKYPHTPWGLESEFSKIANLPERYPFVILAR
jgi:hypothetical protein